jgi:hypothetical protein
MGQVVIWHRLFWEWGVEISVFNIIDYLNETELGCSY